MKLRLRFRCRTVLRFASVVLLALVGAFAMDRSTVRALEEPTTRENVGNDEFDAFARQLRISRVIPSLSIAVARGDSIVFVGNYGFQDHDGEEPTTSDTSYLAASITKTFSAATLLAMEADGHISLDDDFTTFSEWDRRCSRLVDSGVIFGGAEIDGLSIPALNCDATITLEHVLSHRVNGVPGADFIYNPVIFGRLSNYVEEKTGRSWRAWMREYVVDAGNLDGIAAGWRDPAGANVLTHLAPPFKHVAPEVDDDGFLPSALPNTELNASSGIIAAPTALAKYGVALIRQEILPQTALDRMWTPRPGSNGMPEPYGLGWYVEEIEGRKVVWHGGRWPDAYAGLMIIVPDEELVLVALGNTDGLHWGNPLNAADIASSQLAAKFLDTFLN